MNYTELTAEADDLLGWKPIASSKSGRLAKEWIEKVLSDESLQKSFDEDIRQMTKADSKPILLHILKAKCVDLSQRVRLFDLVLMPALGLLVELHSSEITVLDLTGFVSYIFYLEKFDVFTKAIRRFPASCINPRAFSVLGNYHETRISIDEPFCSSFQGMQNLEVLQIEAFPIDLRRLLEWCESSLKKLEFLNIKICDEFKLPTGEELIKSFPNVKVFLYSSNGPKELGAALKQLCWFSLPKLQVAQKFASIFCTQSDYRFAQNKNGSSNIRHLNIDVEYEKVCENLHRRLPHVTHLNISGADYSNITQVKRLLQFEYIECLQFNSIPTEILNLFLLKYGSNLRTFCLEINTEEDLLEKVIPICPELERLALNTTHKSETSVVNLKEVHLERALISRLLFLPNLERVTLRAPDDVEDIYNTAQIISKKLQIPKKLKSVVFNCCCSDLQRLKQTYFEAVATLIKAIDQYVPTLDDLKLNINDTCDYLELAYSYQTGYRYDEGNKALSCFFNRTSPFSTAKNWFFDTDLVNLLKKYV